jgi:hypothetical protein
VTAEEAPERSDADVGALAREPGLDLQQRNVWNLSQGGVDQRAMRFGLV